MKDTTIAGTKATVKSAEKRIKTAGQTSKAAIKTAEATAKAAEKSVQATAKVAKASVQAARATAKAAAASDKAIAAGGWVAVLVVTIIWIISLVAGSCFGIFSPARILEVDRPYMKWCEKSTTNIWMSWMKLKQVILMMNCKCPVLERSGRRCYLSIR